MAETLDKPRFWQTVVTGGFCFSLIIVSFL